MSPEKSLWWLYFFPAHANFNVWQMHNVINKKYITISHNVKYKPLATCLAYKPYKYNIKAFP